MDKEKNIECGKRLKECRERANLSKSALGKKLNFTAQHIYNIEKGERSLTPETAKIAADVLAVQEEYLLCESDYMTFEDEILACYSQQPVNQTDWRDVENMLKKLGPRFEETQKLSNIFNAYLNSVLGYREIGRLESKTELFLNENGEPAVKRTEDKIALKNNNGNLCGPADTSSELDYIIYNTPHGKVGLSAADVNALQIDIVKYLEMRLRSLENNIRTEEGWPARPNCISYDSDYVVGMYRQYAGLLNDEELQELRQWLKDNDISEEKLVATTGKQIEDITIGEFKYFVNHLEEVKQQLRS